ncbi:MAG: hypothetical protein QG621_641, partial [Patescibacteria group bacterium]|nr:hypothetical protein [Patescibacteria group bacterium]
IFFFAYAVGAALNHFASPFVAPALIWLPAGLALAMLFLEGLFLWPAVALASLLVNIYFGIPLPAALCIAALNAAQAALGAFILRRTHFNPLLSQLQDVIILIAVALTTTTLTPLLGYGALWFFDAQTQAMSAVFGPWWLGNILSDLIVAPVLIRWSTGWPHRTTLQWAEWLASFSLLTIACYLAFWTPLETLGGVPLVYTVLLPLIWMAVSIGPRGMTLALFIVTALSISGTLVGEPFLHGASVGDILIQVELLDVVLAIIFLTFVSSEEGRKDATNKLHAHVEQLEAAVSRISADDKAKNEFLAILAHELRNPLAPILSSLELMHLHPLPKEVRELAIGMEDRVKTLARLLDDLLDVSRISQKKFKLQRETIDLNLLLERSAHAVQVLMESKGHTLSLHFAPGPLWISGDPVRLEQVVVNLLNNAAKYTPSGGTIVLHSEIEKNIATVRVQDSGVGIPKDMLTKIFEPFLQMDSTRRSEGLGIGLSLAKRLVELHQGSIEARSEGLARGSEFVVRLPKPAVIQLPIPALTRVRRLHATPKGVLHILLVDDNKLAAQTLGKLLSHKGNTVSLAHDAAGALQYATGNTPDVIILDIGLPDMDGYTVARILKERGVSAPLIALTGFGQEEDKRNAKQAGFNYHLTKPVGMADVESVLAQVERDLLSTSP